MFATVSKYNRAVGFGFIVPDDDSLLDFFVCPKFINNDKHHRFLVVGQLVEFDPIDIEGKPQAHNVRIVYPFTIARQVSDKAAL